MPFAAVEVEMSRLPKGPARGYFGHLHTLLKRGVITCINREEMINKYNTFILRFLSNFHSNMLSHTWFYREQNKARKDCQRKRSKRVRCRTNSPMFFGFNPSLDPKGSHRRLPCCSKLNRHGHRASTTAAPEVEPA
jgi:hypothetical protein